MTDIAQNLSVKEMVDAGKLFGRKFVCRKDADEAF
jgi:hypothetical protein